ncbi:MAG: ATP-binding protein [Planctomycetota bacterium]|nr:MAG: ATP-binding protein [Planctomycetota bacterium]
MVDLSASLRKALLDTLERARTRYYAGEDSKAAADYEHASRLALQLAESAPDRRTEIKYKRDALRFRDVARRIARGDVPPVGERGRPREERGGAKPAGAAGIEKQAGAREEDDGLSAAVSSLVTVSNVTWNEIGGLEETKREIKYALALSMAAAPEGLRVTRFRNMMFYGPPGTGKTLLAAATSNALRRSAQEQARAVFYNVKVSSLLSKYFGESPRLVSELYGQARDASPAVVFLDEFDALAGSRDRDDTGAERRILSTILAELDGLSEKGREDVYVLTIAATNRPWDLDEAVLSRFDKKILIPLPDPDTRAAILRIHILDRGFETRVPMEQLVALTEGYSGREIERFAKEVQNRMIQEMNPGLIERLDRGLEAVRDYRIAVRELEWRDFEQAAARITPQTSPQEMEQFVRWQASMSV